MASAINREAFPAVLYVRRRWWGGFKVVTDDSPGEVVEYIRRGSVMLQRVAAVEAASLARSAGEGKDA